MIGERSILSTLVIVMSLQRPSGANDSRLAAAVKRRIWQWLKKRPVRRLAFKTCPQESQGSIRSSPAAP